jgi:hypothetical protein
MDADDTTNDDDEPSLRQRLHAATGDRDAEAQALADRDDDVEIDDAKVAVNRAHGHAVEDVDTDSALASPEDAERAAEDRD